MTTESRSSDLEIADELSAQPPHVRGEIVHRMQEALYRCDCEFALLGQAEPSATALTELDTEALFQRGDMVADRGEADIQLGLGGGKATVADDGIEHTQKTEVRAGEIQYCFAAANNRIVILHVSQEFAQS